MRKQTREELNNFRELVQRSRHEGEAVYLLLESLVRLRELAKERRSEFTSQIIREITDGKLAVIDAEVSRFVQTVRDAAFLGAGLEPAQESKTRLAILRDRCPNDFVKRFVEEMEEHHDILKEEETRRAEHLRTVDPLGSTWEPRSMQHATSHTTDEEADVARSSVSPIPRRSSSFERDWEDYVSSGHWDYYSIIK